MSRYPDKPQQQQKQEQQQQLGHPPPSAEHPGEPRPVTWLEEVVVVHQWTDMMLRRMQQHRDLFMCQGVVLRVTTRVAGLVLPGERKCR